MLSLFGGKKKPNQPSKEQIRELVNKMRREERVMDREIAAVAKKEQELKVEAKKAAKQGHVDIAKIHARNIIQARKAKNRMFTAKAQMESVALQVQQTASAARLASGMQEATSVMHAMQKLVSIPEVQAIARDLSKEMMKMGIMEEIMDDTLSSVVGITDEEEAEADEEVEKVLAEVTQGVMEKAPIAPISARPVPEAASAVEEPPDAEEEIMRTRLEALRS